MPNQYKNKVIYNNQTLIDLTSDTATAADVAQGKTFHLASGEPATGTASGGNPEIVTGSFTTNAVGSENQTVTIPYAGSGFPMSVLVYVRGGWNGPQAESKSTAICLVFFAQRRTEDAADTTSVGAGFGQNTQNNTNTNAFTGTPASSLYACVKMPSPTTMLVKIYGGTSTTRGLQPDTVYDYLIQYVE